MECYRMVWCTHYKTYYILKKINYYFMVKQVQTAQATLAISKNANVVVRW